MHARTHTHMHTHTQVIEHMTTDGAEEEEEQDDNPDQELVPSEFIEALLLLSVKVYRLDKTMNLHEKGRPPAAPRAPRPCCASHTIRLRCARDAPWANRRARSAAARVDRARSERRARLGLSAAAGCVCVQSRACSRNSSPARPSRPPQTSASSCSATTCAR